MQIDASTVNSGEVGEEGIGGVILERWRTEDGASAPAGRERYFRSMAEIDPAGWRGTGWRVLLGAREERGQCEVLSRGDRGMNPGRHD